MTMTETEAVRAELREHLIGIIDTALEGEEIVFDTPVSVTSGAGGDGFVVRKIGRLRMLSLAWMEREANNADD